MKKNLITVLAGICLSALDAEAQQFPADISITVERTELKTERIFNEQEHRYVDYQGTELHAGHIRASFQVTAENPNLSNPGFPDNPVFEVSYADPYGHVFSQSDTGIMTDVFETLPFTRHHKSKCFFGTELMRGGNYILRTYIPSIDYLNEENIVLKDEPTVRVACTGAMAGSPMMEVKACYNTGYPYDVSQFDGSEKAEIRLYALNRDEQGNVTETEVAVAEKSLRLYRPDEPLVAAVDTLQLSLATPAAGEYVLKMSSDWALDGANRDVLITVGQGTSIGSPMEDHAAPHAAWYDLDGRRLGSKPNRKGIYIQDKQKVLIK